MAGITVRVPATSANLGPGFDTLGLALGLYNDVLFEDIDSGLRITGCEDRYKNESNLAYKAYTAVLSRLGLTAPRGLHIDINANIPVSRGLGSSAAMIVAGATAANHMNGSLLDRRTLLAVCTELEGHPDNVAPALYGGLTASLMREDGVPVTVRYRPHPGLRFTALIPEFRTDTHMARKALPDSIAHRDAVYSISHLAVLLKALETGDTAAIAAASDDRLHQPYRRALISGYDSVRETALNCGCCGFVISGSGSTCLAIGGDESFADRLSSALSVFDGGWQVRELSVDETGATTV